MPISNILVALAAVLFGSYELYLNFHFYRMNGYWFYWAAGLWVGLPFYLIAGLSLATPNFQSPVLSAAAGLIYISGVVWKVWMKRRAKRQDPDRWARWENLMNS